MKAYAIKLGNGNYLEGINQDGSVNEAPDIVTARKFRESDVDNAIYTATQASGQLVPIQVISQGNRTELKVMDEEFHRQVSDALSCDDAMSALEPLAEKQGIGVLELISYTYVATAFGFNRVLSHVIDAIDSVGDRKDLEYKKVPGLSGVTIEMAKGIVDECDSIIFKLDVDKETHFIIVNDIIDDTYVFGNVERNADWCYEFCVWASVFGCDVLEDILTYLQETVYSTDTVIETSEN